MFRTLKKVYAVPPYIYKGQINFKYKPYDAWIKLGGLAASSHYPIRALHVFAHRIKIPRWCKKYKKEARLRFVQPYTLNFDTYPDYAFHEIIPFFWDCWPQYFEHVFAWLRKNEVRTAIFTSSQFTDIVKKEFPDMNVMWCPEGIDAESYGKGKLLTDRSNDFLEYGRNIDDVVKYSFEGLKILRGQKDGRNCLTFDELMNAMTESRVVAAYPKSYTSPNLAGNIETLTQRYWECMLSRMVMIGHAPKELVEFIGYNPVIEIDFDRPNEQLQDILNHIEDYQDFADKNRETALRLGSWKLRMMDVMTFLRECGYEC